MPVENWEYPLCLRDDYSFSNHQNHRIARSSSSSVCRNHQRRCRAEAFHATAVLWMPTPWTHRSDWMLACRVNICADSIGSESRHRWDSEDETERWDLRIQRSTSDSFSRALQSATRQQWNNSILRASEKSEESHARLAFDQRRSVRAYINVALMRTSGGRGRCLNVGSVFGRDSWFDWLSFHGLQHSIHIQCH